MLPSHAATTESADRPRRFTPPQLWGGLFGLATAVGLLLFVDRYLSRLTSNRTGDWARVLLEELSGAYCAALLVPVMVYATRRWAPFGARWMAHLPLHGVVAAILGVAHTTTTSLARMALITLPGLGGGSDYALTLNKYLLSLPTAMIVYAVVMALTLVVDRYRGARNRELEAVELRAQLTQAQLEALRRQLEPHFLFNTLNAVSELVFIKPKAAEEMIQRLSALLKHAFAPEQSHETTLADELRVLDLYLDIMRLRFAERLFVQVDAPAELSQASVPRFLLQPLVENALRHSADPSQSLVAVRITVRREGDTLTIRVRDRGPGGCESARGLGLANSAERIAQLYGAGYGISTADAAEHGAEVVARVPLRFMRG